MQVAHSSIEPPSLHGQSNASWVDDDVRTTVLDDPYWKSRELKTSVQATDLRKKGAELPSLNDIEALLVGKLPDPLQTALSQSVQGLENARSRCLMDVPVYLRSPSSLRPLIAVVDSTLRPCLIAQLNRQKERTTPNSGGRQASSTKAKPSFVSAVLTGSAQLPCSKTCVP